MLSEKSAIEQYENVGMVYIDINYRLGLGGRRRVMSKRKPLNGQPPQPPLSGGCQGESLEKPPLIRGGLEGFSLAPDKGRLGKVCAPSLDKGRVGEGLAFLPYSKKLTELARENRKNPTKAESKIWNEVLRMRQFADYKFLRQKPIDNYIADFYCSELQLVIEIDGDSHAEAIEYDAERTKVIEALGLRVVRYSNDDVLRNIQGVYEDLSRRIESIIEKQSKQPPSVPPYQGGSLEKAPGGLEGFSPSHDKGRAGVGLRE